MQLLRLIAAALVATTARSRASHRRAQAHCHSGKGVRLAQKMQVGPCIPVETQLQKAEVGPTSGPTWRLSHS
jgi:hypothetical protein